MAVVRRPGRRGRTIKRDGPDPIDIHVGHRLRQARLLAGRSQNELGAGIAVSFQAVQKYEAGENRISASRLLAAARLLDSPISFFFEGLESAATISKYTAFSRDEIELIVGYRGIPDDTIRAQLFQFIQTMGSIAGQRGKHTQRKA